MRSRRPAGQVGAYDPHASAAARALADLLGRTPVACQRVIERHRQEGPWIARAYVEAGDREGGLAHFAAAVARLADCVDPLDALIDAMATADAAEDVALARYLTDRTDQHRAKLVAALRMQAARSHDVAAKLGGMA